jgi:hypothetical protein
MKHLVVATSVFALTSMLTGCISLPMPNNTEFTEAGLNYQFQTTQSTMRFANETPLELSEGNETTRVLALFGMPDFQAMKPGAFSNFLFTSSEKGLTKHYIAPALSNKPEKSGLTNTDFSAVSVNALSGTGLSAGAVGSAGVVLMIAGTDTTPDPRTFTGSAICYRAISEQPDINKAYIECIDSVVEDLAKALGPDAVVKKKQDIDSIYGGIEVPAYGKQPVSLLVGRVYNHASTGYAPQDKGGFKSYVFAIQVNRFGDIQSSKATVADIAKAIRSTKRQTISFRLNGSDDFRKVKNAEPVGVY